MRKGFAWCSTISSHSGAALYQTFVAEEARRILRKLEFHYTPKHGSWLNMAEIEFSVMNRQCLDGRIPSRARLRSILSPWEKRRNREGATVTWRLRTLNVCCYAASTPDPLVVGARPRPPPAAGQGRPGGRADHRRLRHGSAECC